jgi:predicted nucleic acid-binding protein
MSGPVVSNTTPLSTLARVDCLEWIPRRWGHVCIPQAVWEELECLRDSPALKRLRNAKTAGWIRVVEVSRSAGVRDFLDRLDKGEAEALALAKEQGALLLWMDEAAGRAIALHEGLRVTGTAGMVKWAWQQGFLPRVRPMLERLRTEGGLYLSDAFIDQVADGCGE